jgi:hypothetical protein
MGAGRAAKLVQFLATTWRTASMMTFRRSAVDVIAGAPGSAEGSLQSLVAGARSLSGPVGALLMLSIMRLHLSIIPAIRFI